MQKNQDEFCATILTEEFGSVEPNEFQENAKSTNPTPSNNSISEPQSTNSMSATPSNEVLTSEFEETIVFLGERCLKKTSSAIIAGKEIVVESLTPILNDEQSNLRRNEAAQRLCNAIANLKYKRELQNDTK